MFVAMEKNIMLTVSDNSKNLSDNVDSRFSVGGLHSDTLILISFMFGTMILGLLVREVILYLILLQDRKKRMRSGISQLCRIPCFINR